VCQCGVLGTLGHGGVGLHHVLDGGLPSAESGVPTTTTGAVARGGVFAIWPAGHGCAQRRVHGRNNIYILFASIMLCNRACMCTANALHRKQATVISGKFIRVTYNRPGFMQQ
jgi:hypothetical protein